MARRGAELLFYPTAIGSEPYDADLDTSRMWRRAMQGHAVSNCMPVIAANRIGREGEADFYGHSFITDEWGDLTQQFGREETGVLVETIDLDRAAKHRAGMGFFRSEEHTSELQSLLRISYAVFCLKKKKKPVTT